WTDDDVLVEPQWLEAYSVAIQRWPDVDILGGTVVPEFEREPPSWIANNLRFFTSVFAIRDYGTEPRLLQVEVPIGANMALRRSVHLKFPFDARLGPQPGSAIRGEENLLIKTARAAGYRIGCVPDAVV